MNLIEVLKDWDTTLFLVINGHFSPFFDTFMYAVSAKFTWIPFYLSVLYVLVKHWKKESVWLVLGLILCLVISDQVSSGILKESVKRLRPSHTESLNGLVHLVKGYTGGLYGFTSSHASNAVGFALLSAFIFKHRIYTLSVFTWAFITAYSRIYLGVHYPLDILGGAAVGTLAALLCCWVIQKFRPDIVETNSTNQEKVPVLVLISSLLGIIIYSIAA